MSSEIYSAGFRLQTASTLHDLRPRRFRNLNCPSELDSPVRETILSHAQTGTAHSRAVPAAQKRKIRQVHQPSSRAWGSVDGASATPKADRPAAAHHSACCSGSNEPRNRLKARNQRSGRQKLCPRNLPKTRSTESDWTRSLV